MAPQSAMTAPWCFLPWNKGPTSERYGTTIVHPEVSPDSKPSSKKCGHALVGADIDHAVEHSRVALDVGRAEPARR